MEPNILLILFYLRLTAPLYSVTVLLYSRKQSDCLQRKLQPSPRIKARRYNQLRLVFIENKIPSAVSGCSSNSFPNVLLDSFVLKKLMAGRWSLSEIREHALTKRVDKAS